jgi:hypothetical protein
LADNYNVRIKGLRELDRALRRSDRGLQVKLRARLIAIATDVAAEAKAIATSKGVFESGDLIKKIRPFARAGGAGVRSASIHRGFPYPKRIEFEGRGAEKYGPRASLYPALEDRHNSVVGAAEHLLDDIADDFSKE